MKNGNISDFGTPKENELVEINKYTRREFKADELYAFSVVLCDNEVDRDFERFTDESLEKLATLFLGKTGIFDHTPKAENQCARIFNTEVKAVEGKKTSLGEQYKQLTARAYMPKSEAQDELILSIESGIKKEVSVGCSMSASSCSVCGQPMGVCKHKKGRHYTKNGVKTLCYFNLLEPTDAYEWSFVAVPAQPAAGVVKSYKHKQDFNLCGVEKSLVDGQMTLTADEVTELAEKIDTLQKTAELAGEFLSSKKLSILKMFMPSVTENAEDMFLKALESLPPDELFKLYREGKALNESPKVQLKNKPTRFDNSKNSHFTI